MLQARAALRTLLFGLAISSPGFPAVTPDPLYKALRESAVAETLVADNIVLHRDAGTLTLKSGSIAFTSPALGREVTAVFLGEGEFVLTPATRIEKDHLRSFTNAESVQETFDRAVLIFTDDTAKEIRSQAKSKAAEAKSGEYLRDFRKHLRNDSFANVEAAVLADLYNPSHAGFFSAYMHGRKHSNLQFHVKPRGALPSLGPEEVYLVGVQGETEPDDDLCLEHLQSEVKAGTASSEQDERSVQADSYQIDTEIAKNDHFSATTSLKFHAVAAGDRVIPLGLLPTLRVSKVTADGREIAFIQEDKKEDGAFSVILEKPLEKGAQHELVITYAGDKVVHKAGGGNFAVGARESWYPNVNTFHDHARYDLTFKVPKLYTLVSVGKLEKEWKEQDQACSHWVSEVPLAVAGFNYGTFKKKVVTDAGFAIEGYAATEVPDYLKNAQSSGMMGSLTPSALMDGTMVDAQNAMRVYNAWFGKTDFDRIAITQQPEFNFGQSWPSLVYLPLSAYLDATQRFQLMGAANSMRLAEFIDEVTAHEVSHQWWGHRVGWSSYHDQWLSEGFADFSAGLFLEFTQKTPDKAMKYWQHAREALLEKNNYGRRPNDAGPIWLGARLGSEKNPGAYSRVVYGKGGYVLYMLRRMMFDNKEGERPFIAMMHDFVEQFHNQNASTEAFQRVVEKHIRPTMNLTGDGKMDWFFREWVYGTTIPKYKLEYEVTPADNGKVQLKGSVTQSEVPANFAMLVPVYLDFDGTPVRLGQVRLVGNVSVPIQVQLPKKPKRVLLNAFHDVLEQ